MSEICVIFWFLLAVLVTGVMSSYQIFYADSDCKRSGHLVINIGSSGQNSSGIFKSSKTEEYIPGMYCSIVIIPPQQFGIVASIRLIDMKSNRKCDNYLKLYMDPDRSVKLCDYSSDVTEYQSYQSDGEMTILFHTTNETTFSSGKQSSHFQLTLTSFNKGGGYCGDDQLMCQNSHCVWRGLVCDGHNNCGDQSDEYELRTANCDKQKQASATFTLAVVIPIIVGFLAFMVILIYCLQDNITKKIERLGRFNVQEPSEPPPAPENSRVTFINADSRVSMNAYGSSETTPAPNPLDITFSSISRRQGSSRPMTNPLENYSFTDNHIIQTNRRSNDLLIDFTDPPPYDHPPSYISVAKR